MEIDKKAVENAHKVKNMIFGKKSSKRKKKRNYKSAFIWILFIVLISYLAYSYSGQLFQKQEEVVEYTTTVNDEIIYSQEVEDLHAGLSPDLQVLITKESLLEQLIDLRILLQESKRQGFEAQPEEILELVDNIRLQFPDQESFEVALAEQGYTYDELVEQSKDQIMISKLLDSRIGVPEVSDEEIESFYNEAEMGNLSLEETKEQIRELLSKQKQQEGYDNFLTYLRMNSVIAYDAKLSFVGCLMNKGVKVYGADWCEHTLSQEELVGESLESIYVRCEDDDKNSTPLCPDVDGYPSWEIEGQIHIGTLSKNKISALTGCE